MRSTRTTPHHRKLAMWSALPPYLGGKATPLSDDLPRSGPNPAKAALARAHVPGRVPGRRARVASTPRRRGSRWSRPTSRHGRSRSAKPSSRTPASGSPTRTCCGCAKDDGAAPGRVETDYSPSTFTQTQARFLDRALRIADATEDTAKAALIRLLAIRDRAARAPDESDPQGNDPPAVRRASTRASPNPASTTSSTDCGSRGRGSCGSWRSRSTRACSKAKAESSSRACFDALPTIERGDCLLRSAISGGHELRARIQGPRRDPGRAVPARRVRSPRRTAPAMIDCLFEALSHIPIWLLCFGNAVVTSTNSKRR